MRAHVVQRGEDVASIAARTGCEPSAIWDHADNRELRDQRGGDGQVLAPGDVLYLPDPPRQRNHLIAHTTNTYRFNIPSMTVRMTMRSLHSVLRNEPCVVEGPAEPIETQTDGDGRLELRVPSTVRRLRARFTNLGFETEIRVGELDPVDTDSGVLQRLEHLGYLFPIDESAYPDEQPDLVSAEHRRHRIADALRAWQRDNDLEPTGEADEETRSRLVERHGG